MMYAGVSDPHLPQWMMWVRKGLTPWFHGVPKVMTRGARQILGRVAGQFSHFFQVERHMGYTVVVRRLNISVIPTLLKLGIVFVTSVIYHWNQRVSESQDQVSSNRTTPGLPSSGICFHLRPFASEMNANFNKVQFIHAVAYHVVGVLCKGVGLNVLEMCCGTTKRVSTCCRIHFIVSCCSFA
ncbi:hypothetical protein PROFUN_01601 [Planoprotostelium fungivorum]|uniref:Uncharacterized protein n=1 Tax=Planoprotostelium fungivorum TaxID=1890364 RepID=A0A2P6NTP0_9EUKA|nr:hypothetical protein PROFUN_01601 [Planoprotostelium fungivorum]